MKTKILLTFSLFYFVSISYATIYPEAKPCNPSAFGTYCEIHVKPKPTRRHKNIAYCGTQHVYLSDKQKRVLDAYLREGRNMILRYKIDSEYIDAPCF